VLVPDTMGGPDRPLHLFFENLSGKIIIGQRRNTMYRWCQPVIVNGKQARIIPPRFGHIYNPYPGENKPRIRIWICKDGEYLVRKNGPPTRLCRFDEIISDPREQEFVAEIRETQYGGEKGHHDRQRCRCCHDILKNKELCLWITNEDLMFRTLCLKRECFETFPYENIVNPEMLPMMEETG